jgi:hypothetical protein
MKAPPKFCVGDYVSVDEPIHASDTPCRGLIAERRWQSLRYEGGWVYSVFIQGGRVEENFDEEHLRLIK